MTTTSSSDKIMTTSDANYVHNDASLFLPLLINSPAKIRVFALERLNNMVDCYWPEISEYIGTIEELYEDETFPNTRLAALLASKIYYHLEDYCESLKYALCADYLFDFNSKTEYARTIIAKLIEEYVQKRTKLFDECLGNVDTGFDDVKKNKTLDSRLEYVFEQMLDRCRSLGNEKSALGMAINAKRLDKVEELFIKSSDSSGLLLYCLKNFQSLVDSKTLGYQILNIVTKTYREIPEEKLILELPYLCECLFYQNDSQGVVSTLLKLINTENESSRMNTLMAYQIAFNIVEMGNEAFLNDCLSNPAFANLTDHSLPGRTDQPEDQIRPSENDIQISSKISRLRYILSGEATIRMELQFLHHNNQTDLYLLDKIKSAVDQRNSICHHAIVLAHGLMQAGTTNDAFLRPNLEWFGKATNWAKFSVAGSIGVIHKGHIVESEAVLDSYLPKATGQRGSSYSEAGALFALGIIHANHFDEHIEEYLLSQLQSSNTDEILQHGACLGLGLLTIGKNDEALYKELRAILFMDSAVAGEAAAYAIGLLMLGTASSTVTRELQATAHETQHEKIIRACTVAIALIMYRREEEADELIADLSGDQDSLVRYGAMFCIAMAYCGTSKNSAIRRLLHVSVSDFSDDVRRAAVISLGFVLCNNQEQVPKVLNLLAQSHNPHVRYAVSIAIGIACAGTAAPEAVRMVLPLASDSTDFVRQGALIGLGFLFQQVSEALNPDVKAVRETIFKVLSDKHEDIITRFGAVLAAGLIDSGGRNVVSSFFSNNGSLRQEAAVGFCLFTQFWYWFPLILCIPLTFKTTALIGVTENLKIPTNFEFICNAKPELFAYPKQTPRECGETNRATVHAVLSTATRRNAINSKKAVQGPPGAESAVAASSDPTTGSQSTTLDNEIGSADRSASSGKKTELLKNPHRVTIRQKPLIGFLNDGRYHPISRSMSIGFVVLVDTKPTVPEELFDNQTSSEGEPAPPAPFDWRG